MQTRENGVRFEKLVNVHVTKYENIIPLLLVRLFCNLKYNPTTNLSNLFPGQLYIYGFSVILLLIKCF
jgi:hypothetical protein